MVVRVNGLIATGLIIAENMIVTITQTLASTKFYIDVDSWVQNYVFKLRSAVNLYV